MLIKIMKIIDDVHNKQGRKLTLLALTEYEWSVLVHDLCKTMPSEQAKVFIDKDEQMVIINGVDVFCDDTLTRSTLCPIS